MALPWFEFNGVSSADYDIVIRTLPRLASPQARAQEIVIPGRDGHLTVLDGGHESMDIAIECTMLDYAHRDAVMAWLQGSGDLVSSEAPTRCMKARVSSRIEPEKVVPGIKEFTVVFRCQPYQYEETPSTVELTSTGTVTNLGTAPSLPKLRVYGEGTVVIGGVTLTVAATVGEDYVDIDSDLQECYYGTDSRNAKVGGGFPVIPIGTSAVTLSGVTKVEITGNWRWY